MTLSRWLTICYSVAVLCMVLPDLLADHYHARRHRG